MQKACVKIVITIKEKEASLLQSADIMIDSIMLEVYAKDVIFQNITKTRKLKL